MKKAKRKLLEVEAEIVEAKKVIKKEKAAFKNAKSKLAKENKKIVLKGMKKGLENLDQLRDWLEEEAVAPRLKE
jgi:hypothetical protein